MIPAGIDNWKLIIMYKENFALIAWRFKIDGEEIQSVLYID